MRDDGLHDLAAGDEFIDLHLPFARDSLLYDDLLILPEASIVPLIIVDRHRLLAEDLPRGIRDDVDLHAFFHRIRPSSIGIIFFQSKPASFTTPCTVCCVV